MQRINFIASALALTSLLPGQKLPDAPSGSELVLPRVEALQQESHEQAFRKIVLSHFGAMHRNDDPTVLNQPSARFIPEFNPGIQKNTPHDGAGVVLTAEALAALREAHSAAVLALDKYPGATAVPMSDLTKAIHRLALIGDGGLMYLGGALSAVHHGFDVKFPDQARIFDILCANPYLLAIWCASLPSEASLDPQLQSSVNAARIGFNLASHPKFAGSSWRAIRASELCWNDFFNSACLIRNDDGNPINPVEAKLYEGALSNCLVSSEALLDCLGSRPRVGVTATLIAAGALLASPEHDIRFLEISRVLVSLAHKSGTQSSPELEKGSSTLLRRIINHLNEEATAPSSGEALLVRSDLLYRECIESVRAIQLSMIALELPKEQTSEATRALALLNAEHSALRDYYSIASRQVSGAAPERYLERLWSVGVCQRSYAPDHSPNSLTISPVGKLVALQSLDPRAYPALYGQWAGLPVPENLPNMNALVEVASLLLQTGAVQDKEARATFNHQLTTRLDAYEGFMATLSTEGIAELRERQQTAVRQIIANILQLFGSTEITLSEGGHILDGAKVTEKLDVLHKDMMAPDSKLGRLILEAESYRVVAGRILSALVVDFTDGPYPELVHLATQLDFELGQHTLKEFGVRHGRSKLFVSRDEIFGLCLGIRQDPMAAAPILFEFLRSTNESAAVTLDLVSRCQRERQSGKDPRVALMREFGNR